MKGLAFLGTITAAGLLPLVDAKCILSTTNNLIANSGKVANTSAPNKNDGVFLKVVAFTRDIDRDLFAIGKAHTRDFPQCRVRLLGSHRSDLKANTLLLRALFQYR